MPNYQEVFRIVSFRRFLCETLNVRVWRRDDGKSATTKCGKSKEEINCATSLLDYIYAYEPHLTIRRQVVNCSVSGFSGKIWRENYWAGELVRIAMFKIGCLYINLSFIRGGEANYDKDTANTVGQKVCSTFGKIRRRPAQI